MCHVLLHRLSEHGIVELLPFLLIVSTYIRLSFMIVTEMRDLYE